MRRALLLITLVFIAGLAALTVIDLANNGVSPLDVVSFMILALFSVAIVGALRQPPAR